MALVVEEGLAPPVAVNSAKVKATVDSDVLIMLLSGCVAWCVAVTREGMNYCTASVLVACGGGVSFFEHTPVLTVVS